MHRAHSGNRGIVSTLEKYENIQRFLFGDTRAELSLENIDIKTAVSSDRFFYDWTLFVFVCGSVVAGSSAAWLSPLGFAVNFIFAAVVAYLGVVVGRWLFGRKFL